MHASKVHASKVHASKVHASKVHASKKNYGDLQSAVSAAPPGATLTVRGDCFGTTEIQKQLTIEGSKAKGFGSPTLDGKGAGSVVKVDPSMDPSAVVALSNLTITNGAAQNGGGVSVVGARVTMTNVRIIGNTARGAGGGLYLNTPIDDPVGAGVTCTRCAITGNRAAYGGGAAVVNSTLPLKASAVQHNSATEAGGGLYLFGGTAPPFPAAVRAASKNPRSAASVHSQVSAHGTVCANGVVVIEGQQCPTVGGFVDVTVVSENTAPTGTNVSNDGGTVTTDSTSTIEVFLTDLYWANTNAGTVVKQCFGGNCLPQTIATGQNGPAGVAVDPLNNHVFWSNLDAGTIVEANLDGGDPKTIATLQNGPVGVAVSGNNLYWINRGDPGQSDGQIVAANLDGTKAHVIATGQNDPSDVAVGGGHLYWSSYNGGTVVEANLDASSPHTIATSQNNPNGVAVDILNGHLYWANHGSKPNSGTIVEANLDGSNPHTIATGQNGPAGMAVISLTSGNPNLFWANFDAGTIIQAGLTGENPFEFAGNQDGPNGPAVGP